jgi:hypothetical protein
MAERDFLQLQRELEEVGSRLKAALDPKLRRDLLLEMRRLLAEAEHLAHLPPKADSGPP